jgi:hypothetical protein
MFFIIAGISPKIKVLDQDPVKCPVCNLNQAVCKRIDHYLSLFFIPILRVKRGEPFIMCERCEKAIGDFGPDLDRQKKDNAHACRFCQKPLDENFAYCPHCGRKI